MSKHFWWVVAAIAVLWFFDDKVEGFLAANNPKRIYIVEEDHTSTSGQLNQAERLFELYFENGVHDSIRKISRDLLLLVFVETDEFGAPVLNAYADHCALNGSDDVISARHTTPLNLFSLSIPN